MAEAEASRENAPAYVAAARERGAELLWLHSDDDLAPLGFARRPGYVRLHADEAPLGDDLHDVPEAHYAAVLDAAYRGLWGHKQVAADATPPPGAVVAALHEAGTPIGLCTVFPDGRLVDGPGVAAGHRRAANYARLLAGACTRLGRGPVDVDTWGDAPEVIAAYEKLGFSVVEQTGGWELRLHDDR